MKKDIPAFPLDKEQALCQITDAAGNDISSGMTLRDYFAANASERDIEKYQEWYVFRESWGIIVMRDWRYKYTRDEARYRYADAMLAAREVKHEHD